MMPDSRLSGNDNGEKMLKKAWQELKKDKFLISILGALLTITALYFLSYGLLNTVFAERAVLGIKINNLEVGGKTRAEIRTILEERIANYKKENITIKVGANEYKVLVSDLNPDYLIDEVLNKTISYGKNTFDPREFAGGQISVSPSLKKDALDKFYAEIETKENEPAQNSKISYIKNEITFTEAKEGSGIKESTLKDKVLNLLATLETAETIEKEVLAPTVTKEMLEQNKTEIDAFLKKPLTLKYEKVEEKISIDELSKWLGFENKDDGFKFVINKDSVSEYLKKIAPKLLIAPVNAELTITDGKVSVFVPSRQGQSLDEEKSLENIINKALTESVIELVVVKKEAEVSESSLNNLGIKELIASGTSNFKGSSKNRIHNVKTGASKFNGVLIKPDETFSFNKYLGEVDASTGYLPELVILKDKTEPQYGGGLCQVSSTVFRAALNGGMPIVARLNHAYPVKYYYPIGADATIYLPNPDFKFKNDTGAHILMQPKIVGTTLTFDFYGTKVERSVKFSGYEDAREAVTAVENVKPYLFNQNVKGPGSVDSIFYRFIYDKDGKLINTHKNVSKYDSPDKYPKPEPTPTP